MGDAPQSAGWLLWPSSMGSFAFILCKVRMSWAAPSHARSSAGMPRKAGVFDTKELWLLLANARTGPIIT